MLRALPYIVPVALAVYALIEVVRARPSELSGLPRWAWAAIVLLLPVVGPVAWLVLSRIRRSEAGASRPPGPRAPGGPLPRRRGPVAPDDDPDFLWHLEQEARRRRRAAGEPQDPAEDDPRA